MSRSNSPLKKGQAPRSRRAGGGERAAAARSQSLFQRAAKPIGGFFLRLVVYYSLGLVVWAVAADWYRAGYRAAGGALARSFSRDVMTRVRPLAGGLEGADTEILLGNRRVPDMAAPVTSNSHRVAYIPTVTLIALVLATPIRWSRRGWAVVWGLLLVHAFATLRLGVTIFDALSADTPMRMFHPPAVVLAVVVFLSRGVFQSVPLCSFLIPVLIWAVVTLRRGDWESLSKPKGRRGEQRRAQA